MATRYEMPYPACQHTQAMLTSLLQVALYFMQNSWEDACRLKTFCLRLDRQGCADLCLQQLLAPLRDALARPAHLVGGL